MLMFKVKDKGHFQVLTKAYTDVKFYRLLILGCPKKDLHANLHLTLKCWKVKVKDNYCTG